MIHSSRNPITRAEEQKSSKKSIDEAFKRTAKRGPVTWASLALVALAGGGLLLYVRYLKEEKERSKKAINCFRCFNDKLCDMVQNSGSIFIENLTCKQYLASLGRVQNTCKNTLCLVASCFLSSLGLIPWRSHHVVLLYSQVVSLHSGVLNTHWQI